MDIPQTQKRQTMHPQIVIIQVVGI